MDKFSDLEIQRVACDILKYIQKRPQQKDTLKGLCEWWLLEERLEDTIDLVTEALGYLISRKILVEIANGRVDAIYQLNPALNRFGQYPDIHEIIDQRVRA
ncbi:MAG: hypothetical protein ONB27_13700 [candidate division KSB1 bacterium]|nr:hypothetical protein [candidate division KSB1 bacterium]